MFYIYTLLISEQLTVYKIFSSSSSGAFGYIDGLNQCFLFLNYKKEGEMGPNELSLGLNEAECSVFYSDIFSRTFVLFPLFAITGESYYNC